MKENLIKVKTIGSKHVSQLTVEHYWEGEYSFDGKTILGSLAHSGAILVRDESKASKELHLIAPIAFIDWQLEKLGCWKRVDGKRHYAPTPHTDYAKKAQAAYDEIPQLFID